VLLFKLFLFLAIILTRELGCYLLKIVTNEGIKLNIYNFYIHKIFNKLIIVRMMKSKALLNFILGLSIICTVFSLLIEYQNIEESRILDNICTATSSSCNSVQNSEYGKILGIKVVHIGVGAFLILTLFALLERINPRKWTKLVLLVGTIIAGIMGIYFISVQSFVLMHYCIYCLIIDSSSIMMMIIYIIYFFRSKSVVKFQKAL